MKRQRGYAPRIGPRSANERDAFSHSAKCDEYFSKLSDIPGGEPHTACACWCHGVGFDKDEPPEYITEQLANETGELN